MPSFGRLLHTAGGVGSYVMKLLSDGILITLSLPVRRDGSNGNADVLNTYLKSFLRRYGESQVCKRELKDLAVVMGSEERERALFTFYGEWVEQDKSIVERYECADMLHVETSDLVSRLFYDLEVEFGLTKAGKSVDTKRMYFFQPSVFGGPWPIDREGSVWLLPYLFPEGQEDCKRIFEEKGSSSIFRSRNHTRVELFAQFLYQWKDELGIEVRREHPLLGRRYLFVPAVEFKTPAVLYATFEERLNDIFEYAFLYPRAILMPTDEERNILKSMSLCSKTD